ncbi:MAG: IS30 family transposase [Gemmatimonadaceae bacterium]
MPEREEISRGLLAGDSCRVIARRLGRSPSTVSPDVAAGGSLAHYRAWRADEKAHRRARRPKTPKLVACPRLRVEVERGLTRRWSPQQIAARLVRDFPENPEMRVSHETIYQSLFVQGRGELRQELTRCLRSGRAQRRPQGRALGSGQLKDLVLISERPADIEDRAVPGHWEGDLILGKQSRSAIATPGRATDAVCDACQFAPRAARRTSRTR